MIDHAATHIALRNLALAAVAATTGTTSLGATGTTFTRSSGSFVTDGFAVGMEVVGVGFSTANNAPAVVRNVAALSMTVDRTLATQSGAGSRSLSAGVPALRASENVAFASDVTGRPYWREDFVPATRRTVTYGGRTDSLEEETGLYVGKLYGLAGLGVTGIRSLARAILLQFTPGTDLSVGSSIVWIRGNPAPWPGQITPTDTGHAYITITVPWRATSRAA